MVNEQIMFGCDPEFFFKSKGRIIGSEKVLSKNGLESLTTVVKDGIQAELNPLPNTCREVIGNRIAECFREIASRLDSDIEIDFSQLAKVTKREMDSLSDDSKRFGCAKSENATEKGSEISIKDASKYMFRSAGGHIHLSDTSDEKTKALKDNADELVKLFDIIVGNTFVLLDRDKGNIERRKVYGRAGEYRINKHGIEYRTLSNFWLRNYALMSLAFGLIRYAVNVWKNGDHQKFFDKVDYEVVKSAINNNDFELAQEIFDKIKVLFPDEDNQYYQIPLTQAVLKKFKKLVKNGVDKYFPKDIVKHWVELGVTKDRVGWDSFIRNLK